MIFFFLFNEPRAEFRLYNIIPSVVSFIADKLTIQSYKYPCAKYHSNIALTATKFSWYFWGPKIKI